MKEIKLKSIAINNFKGITNFTLDLEGKDVDVFGDNDAGKTSIYDAFLWCLFHKDSKERSQFNWKPLDSKNNPIEGLQTSVKITLLVNGKEETFEKIRISKKVLKRKLAKEVYEDSSKYLVNGLETKTRQLFDKKVAELMEQDVFKNLTSITYFAEELTAAQRRESLFNYFGTKTDEEIIDSTKKLHPLKEIKGSDSVNDARERVLQQSKQIDATLKNIPIKIEGIQSALPELTELSRDELTKDRQKFADKKAGIQDQLVTIKNGGSIGEYRSQLREKEAELNAARINYGATQNSKLNGIEQGKAKLFGELNQVRESLAKEEVKRTDFELKIQNTKETIRICEDKVNELYQKYDEIDEQTFKPATFEAREFDENKLECSLCHREFDQSDQEMMKQHHAEEEKRRFEAYQEEVNASEVRFNERKEEELNDIRETGRQYNSDKQVAEENLNRYLQELDNVSFDDLKAKADALEKEMSTVSEQITKLEGSITPFEETEKYQELQQAIISINQLIAADETAIDQQIIQKESEIQAVENDIQQIDQKLAMFIEYDRQQSVIEELNESERELSAQKGVILEQLALFEEFYITKRDLLQDHINSHFSIVKWKLFGFYDNGALDESVCEPMINGVPFSGLNNGSQMQAGLDVANTLMQQEGYLVPIFIDNAEGLTNHKRQAVKIDTQIIALYVNEADKNLRVVKRGEGQ